MTTASEQPHTPGVDDQEQTIMEHLRELTSTLKRSVAAILVGFTIAWFLRDIITDIFQQPLLDNINPGDATIQVLRVTDVITIHLRLAFYAGLLISMPYILFQIWKFIMPGLFPNERRFFAGWFIAGTLCFVGGTLLGYYYALPRAFSFLVSYSVGSGLEAEMNLSLPEHIKFVTMVLMAFGILAEIPLLMVASCWTGIVSPDWYAKKRGVALVVLAILSAMLTPPDPMSMILMLGPLMIFYEAAIWISRLGLKLSGGPSKTSDEPPEE